MNEKLPIKCAGSGTKLGQCGDSFVIFLRPECSIYSVVSFNLNERRVNVLMEMLNPTQLDSYPN